MVLAAMHWFKGVRRLADVIQTAWSSERVASGTLAGRNSPKSTQCPSREIIA